MLKESGPIPGDTNGVKGVESAKRKRRPDKGVRLWSGVCLVDALAFVGKCEGVLTEGFRRLTWTSLLNSYNA